mmetsp:Transcript_8477/g.18471  ORF Transcript_8477/g.18471 Transcript_8477/m.18471 type:complete len:779 (-) Transcript_8477:149-2485(-)
MPETTREPLIPKAKISEPFQVTGHPPRSVLLNPFAWLLWALDFCIWLITIIGPIKWLCSLCRKKSSVQTTDGSWRNAESVNGLRTSLYDNYDTVPATMAWVCEKYAKRPAMGTRTFLGEHTPNGSKFPLKMFGDTTWINYAELGHRVNAFGAGLIELGLKPTPVGFDLQKNAGPHTILIYEDTCAWWMTACLGAFTQSIVVATSYATLGVAAVAEAIQETGAVAIVCNQKDVAKIQGLSSKCPSLKAILYTDNNVNGNEVPEGKGSCKALSMQDVIELGKKSQVKPTHPKPDQLAVIMYTSGSTGKPKGVMIKHSSLSASVGGIGRTMQKCGGKDGHETYLAYLPAAHILELCAEISNLCLGSAVGFADPRTISSKGACRQRPDGTINTSPGYPYPPGAIQEFRPSVMAGVPKIWDILKKGVEEVVGKGSPVKKFLFQVAFTGRYWALKQGRESPLFKLLIFKKLSNMLGGQLLCGITGGGPISSDVQTFIRVAFAMPLVQGYALTETTCAGTIQDITDVRDGVIGPPIPSVEMKLCDCVNEKGEAEVMDREKRPYCASDRSHYGMPCLGRGEIAIRGPSVSAGYFKQQDKTDEVFRNGWFYSGDVGLVTTDGSFMIVDRVKNLVKLKGGEYIAIESMEKEYSTSVFVNGIAGGLLCYGDGDMDRPVALVQVNPVELEKWASKAGVQYNSIEELCKMPEAEKAVLDNLLAAGKGRLCYTELLVAVGLLPGTGPMDKATPESPWTPENGGLTASNKLNRKPIQEVCGKILATLKKKAIR